MKFKKILAVSLSIGLLCGNYSVSYANDYIEFRFKDYYFSQNFLDVEKPFIENRIVELSKQRDLLIQNGEDATKIEKKIEADKLYLEKLNFKSGLILIRQYQLNNILTYAQIDGMISEEQRAEYEKLVLVKSMYNKEYLLKNIIVHANATIKLNNMVKEGGLSEEDRDTYIARFPMYDNSNPDEYKTKFDEAYSQIIKEIESSTIIKDIDEDKASIKELNGLEKDESKEPNANHPEEKEIIKEDDDETETSIDDEESVDKEKDAENTDTIDPLENTDKNDVKENEAIEDTKDNNKSNIIDEKPLPEDRNKEIENQESKDSSQKSEENKEKGEENPKSSDDSMDDMSELDSSDELESEENNAEIQAKDEENLKTSESSINPDEPDQENEKEFETSVDTNDKNNKNDSTDLEKNKENIDLEDTKTTDKNENSESDSPLDDTNKNSSDKDNNKLDDADSGKAKPEEDNESKSETNNKSLNNQPDSFINNGIKGDKSIPILFLDKSYQAKPSNNPYYFDFANMKIILKEADKSKLIDEKNITPATITLPEIVEIPKDFEETIKVKEGYKYIIAGTYTKNDLLDKRNKLKKALTDNQIKYDAAIFLIENTPKSIKDVEDKLLDLVSKSKRLQQKAQLALNEYDKILTSN